MVSQCRFNGDPRKRWAILIRCQERQTYFEEYIDTILNVHIGAEVLAAQRCVLSDVLIIQSLRSNRYKPLYR